MYTPRIYQQEAHDAVIEYWRTDTRPCVIEAATGAGKSWMIAMIAKTLYNLSGGKRVLCLAPQKELIEQNSEKYKALGEPCSIYSASVSKSLRYPVVFATEGTFKRVAKRLGREFAGVIVDECHRTTPTIKQIIDDMRQGNENLRVCGLSATPFRLGEGFVFAVDNKDRALPAEKTKEPYFHKLVYSIGARELIEMGYLTPIRVGDINSTSYDTSGLKIQSNGSFSPKTINAAFEGWGRETSAIVADVVAQSRGAMGVMIFAATVRHAEEVMASLHPSNARMIGGTINTSNADRKRLVDDFHARKYKYLVSVGTMTTGVDFAHVDVVAILRATESISLLQQIIGRGMRLHPEKKECLLLDYAENLDRHCPDGDIYRPEIKAQYQGESSGTVECKCPDCDGVNLFSARKNDGGLGHDEWGYWTDLDGNQVMIQDHKGEMVPMPGHYGRRCQHSDRHGERCDYYWSSKECPVCEHHNDITARYCEECAAELINPNEKLIALHKAHKKDPTQPQSELVVSMSTRYGISRAGNEMLTVDFVTSNRALTLYFPTRNNSQYENFKIMTNGLKEQPRTITYKKTNDFWRLLSINQPTDEEQLKHALSS